MGAAEEQPSAVSVVEAPAGLRCADAVVDALERAGVDTFYGVPGGAISPIYDALLERPHLRVIHTRHETTAVFMAIGHVRRRPGSVPCVLATSGPGVTNALTGLAAAHAEGVSVVMLAGEVPVTKFNRGALQEGAAEAVDVIGMVRSVTRSARQLSIATRAPFQVGAAVLEARRGGGGPVFLSLPLDVATASIQARFLPHSSTADAPLLPPSEALDDATAALRGANRPLLLLGTGAREARVEVLELCERLRCAVITSPKAKGVLPEDHPQCLGVFGYGGHASALEWLLEGTPDVTLAVGCGLNEVSTNSWSPLLQASADFIQVDIDTGQFGRNYRTDIALHGAAKPTLRALLTRLGPPLITRARGTGGVRYLEPERASDDSVPLAPARVLTVLQEEMPAGTVYTSDIGEHLLFAIHYLRIGRADDFIAALALGSMGSGIGAAIGAKVADPSRPVVAICGDYGWQMYGMDLHTCVQEQLGVIFLVMNDNRMRMVESGIERIYGRSLPMDGPVVDFAAAARAQGAEGLLVRDVASLRAALAERLEGVPRVIDVRIDPGATFPMNSRVAEISNFVAK